MRREVTAAIVGIGAALCAAGCSRPPAPRNKPVAATSHRPTPAKPGTDEQPPGPLKERRLGRVRPGSDLAQEPLSDAQGPVAYVRRAELSPRQGRLIYQLTIDAVQSLAFTDRSVGPFAVIGWIGFSPDGEHFAAIADCTCGNTLLVQDAEVQEAYPYTSHFATFSPDGQRLAYLASDSSDVRVGANTTWYPGGCFVVVDGKRGRVYHNIHEYSITFSGDSRHIAYVAQRAPADWPKGRWYSGDWSAVLDGEPGPKYSDVGDPVLSFDGQRLAYTAARGGRYVSEQGLQDAEHFVVVDGEKGRVYDEVRDPIFSPDGSHVGYVAVRQTGGDDWQCAIILDGREELWYRRVRGLTFSPDSGRYAYVAQHRTSHERDEVMVVDGRKSRHYFHVSQPQFSPAGSHLAYAAHWLVGWRGHVVVDKKPGPEYERVSVPIWSSDGKRIAYAAERDGQWFAVIDGTRGLAYDAPGDAFPSTCDSGGLCFSPDGTRFAYRARKGDKWLVVVDGKAGPEYDAIEGEGDGHAPIFSSDSERVAYAGKRGEKWVAVLDGHELAEYDYIDHDSFRLLGTRVLQFLAVRDGWWLHVTYQTPVAEDQ